MGNVQAEDMGENKVMRLFIDLQDRDGKKLKAVEVISDKQLQEIADFAAYVVHNSEESDDQKEELHLVPKGASRHNHVEHDGQAACPFCNYHKDEVHDNLEE